MKIAYNLRQPVYIVSDQFEMGLPLDERGTVIGINPDPWSLMRYMVWVPSERRSYWIAERDLASAAIYFADEAERILASALIDYSLATWNQALFDGQFPLKDGRSREA